MIFIALFLIIFLAVIGLNIYDSSNLEKIENFIKSKDCQTYIYAKGSYKALCPKKLIKIENSFVIDFDKNLKEINYTDIKNMKMEKLDILINDKMKIKFKKKENLENFYKKLEKKVKNI